MVRDTVLALLFGTAGYLLGGHAQSTDPAGGAHRTTHLGPTIEQVRQLSALVTTRVDVADVQVTEIAGRTGGIKAALVIKGDLLLTTDLGRARFESVDAGTRTAVLVLSEPEVTSPRLDHDKTRVFVAAEYGLWALVP